VTLWRDHVKPWAKIYADTPPDEKFASMFLSEQNTNPWQPSLDAKSLPQHPDVPTIERQDSGKEAWSSVPILPPSSRTASGTTQPPVLVIMPTEESHAWDEDELPSQVNLTPSSDVEVVQPEHEEENAWQENVGEPQNYPTRIDSVAAAQDQYFRSDGGWESGLQAQESGIIETAPKLPARPLTEGRAPGLPPRPSQETATKPLLGTEDSTSSATGSATAARRQKKETYEIKNVSWYDATASSNPRVSPILVQNANGPCPLLALVNALTLSTPAEVNTALVETLRSREQVSLGLLLDAVFDELMSGRRGDAAQELPDVGDLYAFLVTLHTGMNVNPRFFPPATSNSLDDPRRSMSHVHPIECDEAMPGTFEETREMKLYSTFSVPLIHGWLPTRDSPAYAALARSARSYEDGQNLMFREEELEDKLQREGLSFEEQSTLEDISTIKAFFNESATQLTPYGLEIITKSMAPGAVAILFRNDHFSTLYRHPESHQLLQLVTDMGYAGHEEVVWESLVDVNGENCEFFSGDFRPVGGASAEARRSVDISEWTTTPSRGNLSQNNLQVRNPTNTQIDEVVASAPMPTNTEQEDHDLALALQLQDEEEHRHQEEMARRRHEVELSQQYIEQQASQRVGNQVPVTARGGGRAGRNQGRNRGPSRGASELRPAIPPRRNNTNPPGPVADPEAGVDVPPPSYEQAATQEAYIPPVNHPAHPSASVERLSRRQSAYSANSSTYANNQTTSQPTRGGRVNSAGSRAGALINEAQTARRPGLTQQQQDDRSKDCIVM
jgi:ubiquitin carboxyl-terminal hydrolase MINDY-1/2